MDRKHFSQEFMGLCETFGKEVTKTLSETYYRVLQGLTDKEFSSACSHILSNRKYNKLPLPAEFLSFIHGDPEQKALIALEKLERAVREIGGYNSIVFDDPVIHQVVASVPDQWIGVCNKTLDEWVWFRKDFAKLYQAFIQNKDMPILLKLIGRHDQRNAISGHYNEPEYITYFGDRKKIDVWQGQQKQIEGKNKRIMEIAEGIVKEVPK